MSSSLNILYRLAWPLSPIYALAMHFRAAAYRSGAFKSQRLPVPVISVGNLTLGGTGKTPMVLHIARLLDSHGRKPAVVSRGYGGASLDEVNVVSDGKTLLLPADLVGDEPRLLAENLPGVPVLTGPKRYPVARQAVEQLGVDCIILDDGFQHLALQRDHDVVLFNANALLGNGRVFPGGPLREPFTALRRARVFVITGVDDDNRSSVAGFSSFLAQQFDIVPIFTAGYGVLGLHERTIDGLVPVSSQGVEPCFAFCGLANPESFRRTLARERMAIVGFKAFRDHHAYSARDMAELEKLAIAAGARSLITTEKDMVKLDPDSGITLPIYCLKVGLLLDEKFDRYILSLAEILVNKQDLS